MVNLKVILVVNISLVGYIFIKEASHLSVVAVRTKHALVGLTVFVWTRDSLEKDDPAGKVCQDWAKVKPKWMATSTTATSASQWLLILLPINPEVKYFDHQWLRVTLRIRICTSSIRKS